MEYHLTIHFTGANARDATALELSLLTAYLEKINVKRYVACIEPATQDHIHAVYQLTEKRPNIKRDIINALNIDTSKYPNNFCYNKKLKVGQTFALLGGGYLQKGYKAIKTYGTDYNELENGKAEYQNMVARKTIRVSKYNLVDYLEKEMKDHEIEFDQWESALILMLRDKKYNMVYACRSMSREDIETMLYFRFKEPNDADQNILASFFKPERF